MPSKNFLYPSPGRDSWQGDFDHAQCYQEESIAGNPHCWQSINGPPSREEHPGEVGVLANAEVQKPLPIPARILNHADYPRAEYRRRKAEFKTTIHWGQRKLMMAELEFLLNLTCLDGFFEEEEEEDVAPIKSLTKSTLLYVGAAPGGHLQLLSEFFPDIKFVLYDPRDFDSELVEYSVKYPDRMVIRQRCFGDEEVGEFVRKTPVGDEGEECCPLYLISDIRSADPREQGENEDFLIDDLNAQRRWVEQIIPDASMLKFRLPYYYQDVVTTRTPADEAAEIAGEDHGVGTTSSSVGSGGLSSSFEYLDGDIYLPVWGPQTTTECRLVVKPPSDLVPFKTKFYDAKVYGEQMFYFNTVDRVKVYDDPVWRLKEVINGHISGGGSQRPRNYGLCRCFDCSREKDILVKTVEYLKKRFEKEDGLPSAKDIAMPSLNWWQLHEMINVACSSGGKGSEPRTLFSLIEPDWLKEERRAETGSKGRNKAKGGKGKTGKGGKMRGKKGKKGEDSKRRKVEEMRDSVDGDEMKTNGGG